MFGFAHSLEEITAAQPSQRVMKDIWKIWEVKEWANNLTKDNIKLEENIKQFEMINEAASIENREIKEKNSHTTLAYMWKIEDMKEQ